MTDRHPILLAIEASQRSGGIALQDASGEAHIERFPNDGRHDAVLISSIEALRSRTCMMPEEIDGLGVSIGPGGFTGIRLAVVTAHMLAMTVDMPLYAIPSAAVAATSTCTDSDVHAVLVVLASKRDSVWAGVCQRADDVFVLRDDLGVRTSENIPFNDVEILLADRYAPDALRTAARAAGLAIREPTFDPSAALRLTARSHARGDTTPALALRPWYPRPPEAVTVWERRFPDDAGG